MAKMSCDMPDVEIIGTQENSCDENFSGIGRKLYAIKPSHLIKTPQYSKNRGEMRYEAWSFDRKNFDIGRHAFVFNIKKQDGQNQGTGNEGSGHGAAQSLTFTVENDIEKAAAALRIIKNQGDFYWLASKGNGVYQVVGDPEWGADLNFNYDSGKAPTDASGLMVTVSCPNAPSPVMFWYPEGYESGNVTGEIAVPSKPGTGTINASDANLDLRDFTALVASAEALLGALRTSEEMEVASTLSAAITSAKIAVYNATSQSDVTAASIELKSAVSTALEDAEIK